MFPVITLVITSKDWNNHRCYESCVAKSLTKTPPWNTITFDLQHLWAEIVTLWLIWSCQRNVTKRKWEQIQCPCKHLQPCTGHYYWVLTISYMKHLANNTLFNSHNNLTSASVGYVYFVAKKRQSQNSTPGPSNSNISTNQHHTI